jgi:hypothetical protein
MKNMCKFASPTFLFRDICHSQLGHIMQRLAGIGFDGLELYGMFGLDSDAILGFCKESKLEITCDHIHYEEFSQDTVNVIRPSTTFRLTFCPERGPFQRRSPKLNGYPAYAKGMVYNCCITTMDMIS